MKKIFFKAATIIAKNKIDIKKVIFYNQLKNYQILVKLFYSGLCGSQLMELKGERGNLKFVPHMFGHEGSGVIVKIGKKIRNFKVNDEVILTWIKCNGKIQEPFNYFDINKKKVNTGKLTTFSNYTICGEGSIVKKPKKLGFKEASIFGCSILTGCGMVKNHLKKKKSKIIVYGLGGIGFSSLIYLKSIGANKVIVFDTDKSKIEVSKDMGFKNSYVANNEQKKIITKEIFNDGADYCFEACGRVDTIEHGFSLLNKKGTLIFASHPKNKKKIKLDPHELISGKKIIGSWGGETKPNRDIFEIYKKIKKNMKYIKFKVYNFSNIRKAFRDFKNNKKYKIVIKL